MQTHCVHTGQLNCLQRTKCNKQKIKTYTINASGCAQHPIFKVACISKATKQKLKKSFSTLNG